MELGVGMFIRFKDKQGIEYIRKIKNIYLPEDISYRYGEIKIDKFNHNTNVVSRKNILKASHNIIDLIEVGDYVNGGLVEMKQDNYIMVGFAEYEEPQKLYNGDIKSIVTKEQFEAMEYKID